MIDFRSPRYSVEIDTTYQVLKVTRQKNIVTWIRQYLKGYDYLLRLFGINPLDFNLSDNNLFKRIFTQLLGHHPVWIFFQLFDLTSHVRKLRHRSIDAFGYSRIDRRRTQQ